MDAAALLAGWRMARMLLLCPGDAPCARVAAVEHHGCRVLRRGTERVAGRYGKPGIFNTDQGSQFTSIDFTGVLKDAEVAISMDGRGRCMDNIFIERLWRSLKYEAVYLHDLTDGFAAERVIGEWIDFYNTVRSSFRARRLDAGRGLRGRSARGYDG